MVEFFVSLLIASPRKESEIKPVILCAKKLGVQVKIKSGGHDYEGISFRSEFPFVMLDLSNLDDIKIDLKEGTVWVQAGATFGQLYYAIAKKSRVHGIAGGVCFSVGTGGLISGGGFGTVMRKFGHAADNVVDARVMDVNGNILDRKRMKEDMFWAIRGGGGASFGVILAWKLKLVPVPEKALYLGPVDELIPLLKEKFPEFHLEKKDCFQEPAWDCSNRPCIKKECRKSSWIGSILYFYGRRTNESLEVLLEKSIPTQKNYFKATSDFVKTLVAEC
ncbi:putative cannabidiolic acid synthase-like [Capsicum annuum]|nr:putative cannabidiolic acid synthase-like [Capsicum annuum]